MEESIIWRNVKIINPIWPSVTAPTSPAHERVIAVNVSIITGRWDNYRPVISLKMWSVPMTAPSVASSPPGPEDYGKPIPNHHI